MRLAVDPYADILKRAQAGQIGVAVDNTDQPSILQPYVYRDPRTIKPREWLYGTKLLRRFVTVLVAPGGTGKTLLATAIGLSMASGKSLLGEHIHHRVPAWIMNLEDPLEEMERRIAAAMIRHDISGEEIANRLWIHSGRDRRVTMATLAMSEDGTQQVAYPDKDAITKAAREHGIGVIIVDPFVKSHTLEENSNPHMDAVATAWAEVANDTGCAILLVHHVRKGAVTDIDAARGGKALTDAARVGLLLSGMTEEEGTELDIAAGDRWQYVRVDDAKVNMAPRAIKASWYRIETVPLGNSTPDYPHGDNVASITPWTPPNPLKHITNEELNGALDEIDEGPSPGVLYTDTKRGGTDRWAGQVLINKFDVTEPVAAKLIASWVQNGVLKKTTYTCPKNYKPKPGVRVDSSKRPTV